MNYNKHFELEGKHAILSASKCTSWLEKEPQQVVDMSARAYATTIGTALHDIARKHIRRRIKLTKAAKSEVILSLIEDYKIPEYAIERGIDFDAVYENIIFYVKDSINYRMIPEQILYYSENCFGTADAISSLDNVIFNKKLQIHDLKTGTTLVHIDQLEVYAALFCLEYNIKPFDIDIELRIYQTSKNEILCHHPAPDDIVHIMDQIITADKYVTKYKEEN